MQSRVRSPILILGLATSLGCLPTASFANEPPRDSAASPGASTTPSVTPSPKPPTGSVHIDQLLKLPASYRADDARRGGATRLEWRARFDDARANLAAQENNLARLRGEMEAAVGAVSQWQMAPPGAEVGNNDNPTSFRLTQELRRSREEVRLAEKRLTELDIEANLANVPDDWRL